MFEGIFHKTKTTHHETDTGKQESTLAVEKLLSLMSEEGRSIFNAITAAQSQEEYLEHINEFNKLGAEQLGREDAAVAKMLEQEPLASRQMETMVRLPYGRTLRISRAMNGVMTLSPN